MADDEPAVLLLVSRVLESVRAHVLRATDGIAAAEICKGYQDPIDLLITDLTMPGFNGLDLVKSCEHRHMPILIMSGAPSREMESALALPRPEGRRVTFIHKPFWPQQLLTVVKSLID